MSLVVLITALWAAVLLVLIALVRRYPVIRHRCRWCGDTFWERPDCDWHESHCPGNPTNHPRRVR